MTKNTFPEFIRPMMAQSVKAPFDSPDWIFEIKLDGYRAITVFDAAGKPYLWSRNGLPLEGKFPTIAKAVSSLKLRSSVVYRDAPKRFFCAEACDEPATKHGDT
jgi:bifunctional non-homologous end joining protein LigD